MKIVEPDTRAGESVDDHHMICILFFQIPKTLP